MTNMSLYFFLNGVRLPLQMGQIKNKKLLYKIATEIKNIRMENEVTLQQFYNDTGIHLARIEQGKNNISISTLKSICTYFKITLVDFFKKVEE
jgi:DNA-binding XRE family transcriptional regulator